MRNSTVVLLLALLVAVAAFGWKALGYIVVAVVGLVVLLMVLSAVAVWAIRRRMRRDLNAILERMPKQASPVERGNVIDVEPTEARDMGRPPS